MTTRIAVTGAAGRMGRTLIQLIADADDLRLGAAFERSDSPALGGDAGELAGVGSEDVPVTADVGAALDAFDVLIDFSVPAATLELLRVLAGSGRKLVIGTTGFDPDGVQAIETAAREMAIMKAPNMSVGVNVVFALIEMATRALGDDVDVEIIEAHHRHKIDAPSGTALHMGEIVAEVLGRDLATDAVYGREGTTGPRERRTIGFSTVRAGDIVGEHTVLFAGTGERIEITHRAQSRTNFAQGALRAARFLAERESGLYDMQDVLGFTDALR
ncbi:MAG: 4-hydroxy-tetrahydrodipicolinate reductase [Pseudomonadales bacterium]|jgi:4-hydroxy-tetrahydrodipicolinate reductase